MKALTPLKGFCPRLSTVIPRMVQSKGVIRADQAAEIVPVVVEIDCRPNCAYLKYCKKKFELEGGDDNAA